MKDESTKLKAERQRRYQQTYRKRQQERQLKRLELQLESQYKERFDALVNAKADDLPEHWHQQRRIAQARRQVLQDALANTQTSFITLKEKLDEARAEIRALSPAYFKSDLDKNAPLPQAIESLPNEPEQLKQLLARFYKDSVLAKRSAEEWKRRGKQYEALYAAASDEVDRLRALFNSE